MSDEKKDIQMTTAICTQCGASVEVDPKQEAAVCKYCGTPFIIEKAINKYNVQNAEGKHVYPINIVKTGVVESVLNFADKQITMRAEKKKRIEEENKLKREKSLALTKKYWWVYAALMGICVLILAILTVKESNDSVGKIIVNISSSELVGENYEDVVSNLEKAGFTNIETEVLDDLVTGWLKKDGEVEKVEIDGTTSFSSDSKFEPNSKIVVTYHTFPVEDTESVAESKAPVESETSDGSDVEKPTEEFLTMDNCEDLAAILSTKNEFDPIIKEFAQKYAGRTIEFDGNTAAVNHHGDFDTRFDYLIYAGDFSVTTVSGPSFQLSDVNYSDLHLTGDNVPDTFGVGLNIHIVATVEEYSETSGLFKLKPVSIKIR